MELGALALIVDSTHYSWRISDKILDVLRHHVKVRCVTCLRRNRTPEILREDMMELCLTTLRQCLSDTSFSGRTLAFEGVTGGWEMSYEIGLVMAV